MGKSGGHEAQHHPHPSRIGQRAAQGEHQAKARTQIEQIVLGREATPGDVVVKNKNATFDQCHGYDDINELTV